MDVGKEDGQVATGTQQLGQFDGGNEVTAMRSSSGRPAVMSRSVGMYSKVLQIPEAGAQNRSWACTQPNVGH